MRMHRPNRHRVGLAMAFVLALVANAVPTSLQAEELAAARLSLDLRTRVQPFKGRDVWQEVVLQEQLPADKTAILICDMWDKHWCQNATTRCDALAHKMAPIVDAAREAGVLIVHAPSETMNFYEAQPQRTRIVETPQVEPPAALPLADHPLPIDDSGGGCDDADESSYYQAWTRQHPAISIAGDDVISDDGRQIYSYLQQRGIENLIVMGVHTNMCVLGRSFGIRQMSRWGLRCILVRDLTDTMYDPRKPPYVSHDEGTALVVEHIEKYWCPSIASSNLADSLRAKN